MILFFICVNSTFPQPARLVLHIDGGLLPEDRVLWMDVLHSQQVKIILKQQQKYSL